ncbi:MAG: aryl-sulfate sulfotransferase [Bacteroidota bacterium]
MYKIFSLSLIIIFAINSCTNYNEWQGECIKAHDIGLIKIIPSLDYNVLRGIFTVETAKKLDSYIRYWEYTESDSIPPDSLLLYSSLSKNRKNHELMIVNLKQDTKYEFNVVIQNNVCKTYSKTYEFTTHRQPAWLPFYSLKDSLARVNFNGYVHFHSRRKPGYLFIANSDGELVWYKQVPMNVKVSRFTEASTFLTILSEDTLRFSSGKKIAEVDLYGQLLYHFDSDEKGIDRTFHHEVDFDEKGNIMTLIYDRRIVDLTDVGGTENDTVRGDAILIMDKKDNVLWEWSVFDIMAPTDYDNILNEKDDWLHANALVKDRSGNYLISFRNNSQIWKINGNTGELIWKLGGNDGNFNLPDSAKFYGQHNIHFNAKGELVLLDNGNKYVQPGSAPNKQTIKPPPMGVFESRMITFSIDEENMRARIVDEVVFPKQYFTKSQGSSSNITDDLIMFCSTNTNQITFHSQQGDYLGCIRLEHPSYRAQYIEELYPTDYVR